MTAPQMRTPSGNWADADQNTINAADSTLDQERLATLRARAALAGVTMYEARDANGKAVYVVSRWALTRQLDGLDAAEAWLAQVTGVRS